MADVIVAPPSQNGLLRRRNSISSSVIAPSQLSLHYTPPQSEVSSSSSSSYPTTAASSATSSGSSQNEDFELFSIKPVNYTSLKDLLPAAVVNSPRPMTPGSHHGSEILIRNRLVKQAAWAYLQPMSTSPDSSGGGSFLRRLCLRFSGNANVVTLLDFVDRRILPPLTRAVDWLLRAIGIRSVR